MKQIYKWTSWERNKSKRKMIQLVEFKQSAKCIWCSLYVCVRLYLTNCRAVYLLSLDIAFYTLLLLRHFLHLNVFPIPFSDFSNCSDFIGTRFFFFLHFNTHCFHFLKINIWIYFKFSLVYLSYLKLNHIFISLIFQ